MLFSSPAWDSVVYWALDLETGGLDPRTDAILAVGMLPIRERTVRLGEAYSTLVRPDEGESVTPASITAHQLVWGEVRSAPPLGEVVPEIDARLRQGVLLVHHRALDLRFLQRAFRRVGVRWPRPRVVDTVELLLRSSRRARRFRPESARRPAPAEPLAGAPPPRPPRLPGARRAHRRARHRRAVPGAQGGAPGEAAAGARLSLPARAAPATSSAASTAAAQPNSGATEP